MYGLTTRACAQQNSVLLGLGLLLLVTISSGCRRDRPSMEEMTRSLTPEQRDKLFNQMHSTPMFMAGIESPTFVPASEGGLNPKDEVIGVVIDGQAKAYPVSRMSAIADHVVNDTFRNSTGAATPITVTYCDITDCVRVMTADEGTAAGDSLGVGTAGLMNGGLAVYLGDQQYRQMDPIPGLRDFEYQRMTWLQWRYEHPETLVYAGAERIIPHD